MSEAVAIVGIACRVPGAEDGAAFWRNASAGIDGITDFSDRQLRDAGVPAAEIADERYVRSRGVIGGVRTFDASFFGYTPAESSLMDPQHRVFLESAWHALEDAGSRGDDTAERVGVFAGCGLNSYLLENLVPDGELMRGTDYHRLLLASEKDFLAARVSYKLDLTGPAIAVATACSTSLVAVHLARSSILNGECELAIAGGVSIPLPLDRGFLAEAGGVLAPDGRCKPFSASANGIGAGAGVAIVVLQRLDAAIARGRRVYAVIRGSAINNDGAAKAGFTAPGIPGQTAVIRAAHASAGIAPATIGYVQAHGTGTPLGDPVEVAALTEAFRSGGADGNAFCALGSIKGNVGHLDTAAGAIGLITAALALHNDAIPPTLHAEDPNREIDFASSPFFVNLETRAWPRTDVPRRAGVSSFGLGGTNAHVVLEEAPLHAPLPESRPFVLLGVSAKTAAACDALAERVNTHLDAHPDVPLSDSAFTLTTRRAFAHRRATIRSRDRGTERTIAGETCDARRPIVFLFPGGGSQYAGMGRGIYETEPVFRAAFDRCATAATAQCGIDLHAVVYPDAASATVAAEQLRSPKFAFPALFAVQFALVEQWKAWGIRADAMIGHSFGEYVAAHFSGTLSFEDAIALVQLRGELFERMEPGAMLRVARSEHDVRGLIDDRVSIAAINGPANCVVSGALADIERFEAQLRADGVDCRRVPLAAAAHSPLVEPQLDDFARFLDGIDLQPPDRPWISNITGTWITAEEATSPGYWCRHFRLPVRFADGLALALTLPDAVLLEVGPGRTLATLALGHPDRTERNTVISSLRYRDEPEDDAVTLLGAAGTLWTGGISLLPEAFHGSSQGRIVTLPSYPFEPQTHWITPPRTAGEPMSANAASSLERLRGIIAAVGGMPAESIDADATFFELGLDSLALISINAALKKELSVQLTLGDLLGDLSQLSALAAHVDSLVAPAAAPVAAAHVSAPASAALPAAPASSVPATGLEALIAQQLEIMRVQLELMRGNGASAAPVAPVLPAAAEPRKAAKRPVGFSSAAETAPRSLAGAQGRHLAHLVERYTRRTAASKAYAARYREVLADSRAAVGFKLATKEMQYPIVAARAAGSRFWDLDGNEYVDLTNGFGVNFFGHRPEFVERAIAADTGAASVFGPRSPIVGEVAELISELTGMQRVAFCNSGTEAVMAAIRLARTRTGRSRIVTFEGAYHGHSDQTLAQSASRGGETFAEPIAPGIPPEAVASTTVLEYGSEASLDYLRAHAGEFAAVLVEPVQNMRLDFVPIEFLREVRAITERSGTALIFDEMITGFRVHQAGVQGLYGVRADIATYGKLIGGGMPIGVVAGNAEFLDSIDGGAWAYGDASSPQSQRTFFGGTFCQHPLTMVAAAAALRELQAAGPALQETLNRRTAEFAATLNDRFERAGVPISVAHFGSAFRMSVPSNLDLLFYHLIEKGVYVWEWRGCFLSTAHTDADLSHVVDAVTESIEELRAGEYLPPRVDSGPLRFPLTHAQRQLLALSHLHPNGSLAYKSGLSVRVRGPLKIEPLDAALTSLVARHEALRTTIAADGQTQIVLAPSPSSATVVDFSGHAPAERDGAVAAWFEAKNSAPQTLESDALFACHVLRFAPGDQAIVFTAHHIVSDGWSLTNLVGELMAIYDGAALEPAMQYREYVHWRDSFAASAEYARQQAFWLAQFADGVPVLDLPLDRVRPAERTYRAGRRTLTIPSDLSRTIKAFCAQQRSTLFIGLFAAYSALLQRWCASEDVLIGVPAAGRGLDGAEQLFGYCTHMMPVRAAIDPATPFAEHVARTKSLLGEVYANADYPFADLLEKLELRRDRSRAPLIAASFNLDKPAAIPAADGLTLELYPHPMHFSDVDLMVNVIDLGDTLVLDCDYNADVFDAATADRLLESYRTFLGAAIETPGLEIGRIAVIPETERGTRARNGVAQAPFVPVHVAFEAQCARAPQAPALTFEGETLSYAQLNARANQIARHLKRGGVEAGSLVAISIEASADLVAALLGILKAGAAYVPVDPANPAERVALVLADASPRAVVTRAFLDAERAAIDAEPIGNLDLPVAPNDIAYVIYTSGSTGTPKGVLVEHRNVARLFSATAPALAFTPDDVWTLFHSAAFDFSVWEVFGALVHGGRLVVVPYWITRDPAAFRDVLIAENVTVLNQTPSAFRQLSLADVAAGGSALATLRYVIFGGEALEMESLRSWFDRYGDTAPRLVNMYGITETTVHVTYRALTGADVERKRSPIGTPLSDLHAYVLDPLLQPVPRGVVGELFVGGAGVARGYLNREELTRERFVTLPESGERAYRTGDCVRWTNGGELEYLGRNDEQFKVRGFRIEAGEIEAALRSHAQVGDAVVDVRPARGAGAAMQLVAYFTHSGAQSVSGAELRAYLAERLPEHAVPAAFVAIERVPLTRNGKADRKALPDPVPPSTVEPVAGTPPGTPAERALLRIWAEVLGREPAGVDANFFEAGGDSISGMQISSRARTAGLTLSVRDVQRYPTIAAQAAIAVGAGETQPPAAGDETALLPAQRWFFAQEQPDPQHHNMSLMLEVGAGTPFELLERALQAVTDRHPALRTGFRRSGELWEAFVLPSAQLKLTRHAVAEMEQVSTRLQESLRLAEPPLMRAALFERGPEQTARLLLAFHHLVIDGVSLRVVLDDLQTAYARLSAGKDGCAGSPSTAPAAYAGALGAALHGDALTAERSRWNVARGGLTLPLDRNASRNENVVRTEAHASVQLDRDETAALTGAQNVRAEDAMLAAAGDALRRWAGEGSIAIDVEMHGRDTEIGGADLSSSVGWFTAVAPLEIALSADWSAKAMIGAVRSARAAMPGTGTGYLALGFIPQAEILFNYLGVFRPASSDGFVVSIVPGAAEGERSPRNRRTHLLEINAYVVDERLEIDVAFSRALHDGDTIARFAADIASALREIAGALALPDTDLDDDRLERVLSSLGAD